MRNYSLYLKDILAAIESIDSFVEGMSYEDFRKDDKTASAVIRKFEIIGEADTDFFVNPSLQDCFLISRSYSAK